MKHNLVFLESARLIYVRAEGRAVLAGFRSLTVEVLDDPRLLAGTKVLFDYRAMEFEGIDAADVRRLVELLKTHAARLEGVRAVSLVASRLHFAMTRMWEALAEVAHVPMAHQVTFEIDAALKYLGLDRRRGLREELDRLALLGEGNETTSMHVAHDTSSPADGL